MSAKVRSAIYVASLIVIWAVSTAALVGTAALALAYHSLGIIYVVPILVANYFGADALGRWYWRAERLAAEADLRDAHALALARFN